MAAIKYWLWLSSQTRLSPRARAVLAEYYGGARKPSTPQPGTSAGCRAWENWRPSCWSSGT